MSRLPMTVLCTLVLGLWIAPTAGWSAPVWTLEKAVQTALSDNERWAAAQARSAALGEVSSQVGALPDPTLKLNAMNLPVDTFALGQEPMTQIQVGVGQMWPFPGKRPLRAHAADAAAAAAVADSEEIRQQVIRDVTVVWWRLFFLDQALAIVGKNQDLLRQFVTIARTKYSVGRGLQQDVLLAEVELSKLFDQQLDLEGRRDDAAAHLNRLMGWPSGTAMKLPTSADVRLPPVASIPQLMDLAVQYRPALAGAVHRVEMAESRLSLARKDHLPDFMVSALYGMRGGQKPSGVDRPDFATVMLSINVPIDRENRQDRLVAQRRYEQDSRERAAQAVHDRVRQEITGTHARYNKARERVQLLRTGIIPQAQQTVASMQAGYQVNKVDFLNLVRAQITLFNYETRYWKTLATAKGALAKLSAAVGEALTMPQTEEEK